MSEKTTLGLKCPSCGGTVSYDPESREIICSSCDSSFPINKFIELSREKQKTEAVSWDRISGYVPESQEIHLYTCASCGAQVMTEGLNVTGTCPYCGSDFVLDDRFENVSYPSGIIPFKQTREYAEQTMRRLVTERAGIPEKDFDPKWLQKMQGIYIPSWMFDCSVTGIGVFRCVETSRVGMSLKESEKKIETESTLTRIGDLTIEDIPARASMRIREDTLMKLYPFNFDELTDYNPALLTGYPVSLYDVSPENEKHKIEKDVETQVNRAMISSIFDVPGLKTPIAVYPQINTGRYTYILLPLWICRFEYKGSIYKYIMNGQTGEAHMEVPQIPESHENPFKPKASTKVISVGICFAIMLYLLIVVGNLEIPREYKIPFYAVIIIFSVILMLAVYVFNIDLKPSGKKRSNPLADSARAQAELLQNRHGDENIGSIGQVTGLDMKVSLDEPYCQRTYETYVDSQGNRSMVATGFKDLTTKKR
ncbi:MAG: hypothetical protein II038_03870 [Lachnospiraceae bacterium]|nr:hypothetical protein [Lachnospiraceae bacterium]